MKITHLQIKDKEYKNLNIDLKDNKSGIMAFIGNNGSGKSNLLESLSIIFKNLYSKKDKEIPFSFSISYINSGSTDVITITKQRTTIKYYVNNGVVSDVYNKLPKQIVAIYSGEENRLWEYCFKPVYDEYIANITGGKSTGIGLYNDFPKMLYINKFYWHISLLCLLLQKRYDETDNFCTDILNIQKVHIVKFTFNKDNYKNYADSSVKQFIQTLDGKYEYTLEELNDIFDDNGYTITDAYKFLYIAFTPDKKKMVEDIVIKYNDDHLEIEHFSEGEKKILLIKAALEFAGAEDSLFILDEPDAHIHLSNKIQIKKVFERYIDNRQVILTTHSPTLTDTLEEEALYMLNQGKLVPQVKQEILENVSGEFWNKFQQNAFIASRKSIILLVEGKHDKEHINNAYAALKDEYRELDFEIFVLNGESKISPFLSGLYESDFQTDRLYIGIYDNDAAGIVASKAFENIKEKYFKKLKENNKKENRSYYGLLLPKPDEITCECTIETMYESAKFLEALSESYIHAKDHIKDKSIDDISKNIKEGAKNILAKKSAFFVKEDFKHFRKLFNIIKEIYAFRKKLMIGTDVDTTYTGDKSKKADKDVVQNASNAKSNDSNPKADVVRPLLIKNDMNNFLEIYTTRRDTNVIAEFYNDRKIVLKAGSKLSKDVVDSYKDLKGRLDELAKISTAYDNHYLLKEDKRFYSVSGAIDYATGGNMSGWIYWLIKDTGKPLQTIRVGYPKLRDKFQKDVFKKIQALNLIDFEVSLGSLASSESNAQIWIQPRDGKGNIQFGIETFSGKGNFKHQLIIGVFTSGYPKIDQSTYDTKVGYKVANNKRSNWLEYVEVKLDNKSIDFSSVSIMESLKENDYFDELTVEILSTFNSFFDMRKEIVLELEKS